MLCLGDYFFDELSVAGAAACQIGFPVFHLSVSYGPMRGLVLLPFRRSISITLDSHRHWGLRRPNNMVDFKNIYKKKSLHPKDRR
jgi:hypothetical protein